MAIENSIVEKIPYHLVINPDVYFSAGVLSELKKFCDADKKIGLITPKVLYPDGCIQHNCRLIPSFFDLFIRRFLPKNWFSNYRIKNEFRFSNYDTIMEVPFISGCFMFFKQLLKQIGQFDERFFYTWKMWIFHAECMQSIKTYTFLKFLCFMIAKDLLII